MTTLNLIHVPINTNALARWAGERGWGSRLGSNVSFDEGRALHHLVDETLGPGVLRPFRYLVPPRSKGGNLYAYSTLDAEALRTAARMYATPEQLKVIVPAHLESKPMPDNWFEGQRLGFDLRTRPVRRLRHELLSESGKRMAKGAEVDVFLVEALRKYPDALEGMVNENRTREAVYLDWLAERLAPAATLDRAVCRLARFLRTRVVRSGNVPEGPDATIHGTLTVADPDAFTDLLARGVGRHRAYGHGMLLLRPPKRPPLER